MLPVVLRSVAALAGLRMVNPPLPISSILLKKQSANRLVSALRLPDGSIVNSAQDLVDCFADFYPSLFSAEEVNPLAQCELLSKVSARLSVEQSASCEGEFLVEECLSVLQGMAHRKAPDNDGLPMEFYVLCFGFRPGEGP